MLDKLLECPEVYAQSEMSIWQDEHISKQMLQAHLDPHTDGASRNPFFIEKSVSWIKTIAPPSEYQNLIDIGCGPGLYAEKFCKLGYQVTGIDFSELSIQYAMASSKKQDLRISYLHQDYLKMDIYGTFDFAALIYCDYGALSKKNRAILLKKIYQSLKPKGKLLLDVFSMERYGQFQEIQDWQSYPNGGFWSAEKHLAINRHCKHSDNVTLRQTVIITENETKNYYIWDCYFTKESLIKEAQEAGFQTLDIFDDVAGSPFTKESPTIAILLEK